LTTKTLLFLAGLTLAASGTLPAGTLSMNGNFVHDDDVVLVPFVISGASLVTMQTLSFADGSLGFEPVLTLFDGAGNLLFQDATGGTAPAGCGARAIDSVSTFCLDAYIQQILGPGSYTLALTESDNVPSGTLSDGFPHTGDGDFTGVPFGGGPFFLFNGDQRTSAWALEIDGAAVPEPGTFTLLGSILLGSTLLRLRSRR